MTFKSDLFCLFWGCSLLSVPPTSVVITASTNEPRAGYGMNLTCVSSSSNPAAEILWVKAGKRIQGVNRGVVDAEYGGKNTTNVLHFIPTSADHNAVYGCRATNTLLGLSVNDAITLSVLCKIAYCSFICIFSGFYCLSTRISDINEDDVFLFTIKNKTFLQTFSSDCTCILDFFNAFNIKACHCQSAYI